MIARAMSRLTWAAVLMTVVAGAPFLWANAADSAKPCTIKNGVVDQHTFVGYLHYEGTCYWCHGQDATGSSFAPSLVDALKTLSHDEFLNIVVNGGVVNGQPVGYGTRNVFVMPAFGTNANVMCFLDDIYAYLRARSDGAIGRGRPVHQPVTQAVVDQGDACLGFAPSRRHSNTADTRP
jgi:mono/diheme cytochrome c family protein